MFININEITEKDFSGFCDIPVIDCHIHLYSVDEIFRLAYNENVYGIDKMNVLALNSYQENAMTNNLLALLFKRLYPGRVYAFASLQYPLYGAPSDGEEFLRQAKKYIELGFDGMKMMEGKPNTRKRIGIPLDSPLYDKYFDFLQEKQIPVLYHVNDPKIYWDKALVPQSVIENNWAYLDNSFRTKEELYSEVNGILAKFPGLRIIFAHFYFLDEESIERAMAFLDKWPQVSFDLAPGWHFKSFEKDLKRWRDFFIKYQDRILFGTDNDYGISRELIYTMCTILETDNEVRFWDTHLHGMKLDRDALRKIYSANFLAYASSTPRKVIAESIAAECDEVAQQAQQSPEREAIFKDLNDIRQQLKQRWLPNLSLTPSPLSPEH